MLDNLLFIIASITAAISVMVAHEFPKTFIYYCNHHRSNKRSFFRMFKFYKYIDPIGLLLFVIMNAGFSKPYLSGNKEKKINAILGITGFSSMIILYFVAYFFLNTYFSDTSLVENTHSSVFIFYFLYYLRLFAVNMILANLIPISTFDMAQIISKINPIRYHFFVHHDVTLKVILIILIATRLMAMIGNGIISLTTAYLQ